VDWFETSVVILCGVVLFTWGRYFYGQPHVLYRYWHDTNRLYVGLSKLAGAIVMFLGALVASGILLLKLNQLFTRLGLCLPLFALLCTILFRPIRTKKRPWQEFYKPKQKGTEEA
jgi:hypothetical protein